MSKGSKTDLDDVFKAAESLDPDDRMRLIARLWASLPEDYWAAPGVRDRAGVRAMLASNDVQRLSELPRRIARQLTSPPAQPPEHIYSAPRRFDLATILIVTFAYSLLFGATNFALKYSDLPPALGLLVGGFITLVGVGQALLYGGQNARVASFVTGAVLCALVNIVAALFAPGVSSIGMLLMLPFSAALGAGFGYMAGALVGGVFLVADKLRTYLMNRKQELVGEDVELVEVDVDRESHVAN